MNKRWKRVKEDISTIEKVFSVGAAGFTFVNFFLEFLREYGISVSALIFAGLYIYSLYKRFSLNKKIENYFKNFFYLRKIKELEDGTIIAEGDLAGFLTEGAFLQALIIEEDKKGHRIEIPVGYAVITFIQTDHYIVHIKLLQKNKEISSPSLYFKPILQTQQVGGNYGS